MFDNNCLVDYNHCQMEQTERYYTIQVKMTEYEKELLDSYLEKNGLKRGVFVGRLIKDAMSIKNHHTERAV